MPRISEYPLNASPSVAAHTVIEQGGTNYKVLLSNLASLPAGYLFGLTLSDNAGDVTNDIDIATGKCRDSTDTMNMVLAAVLTKRLDAAWAVGTNQGGLDSGAIANTTYHVFLIMRSDTGVVDVLFSTSPTAPTMPASYDYKRRIGSIVRTGGAIKTFVQDGDVFMWSAPVQDVVAINPGVAAVTRTLTLPTGIRVNSIVGVMGYATSAASCPQAILISDLSMVDTAPTNAAFSIFVYTSGAVDLLIGSTITCFTNTSAQVRSRLQVSAATTRLYINTMGWIDTRGRLA